ncbi:MAG: hypothetical protein V3T58_07470 [Candidatus Hydrothermarchaeales archaeon]
MDKIIKNIAILWLFTIALIIGGAYAGSAKGDLGGTDAAVEDMAAEIAGREPSTPIGLNNTGENIAFALAGLLAGALFGYYWTSIVEIRRLHSV